MFQVQSQPASPFNLQMERATHAVHVPNPALNLPRHLQKPAFREVDMRRVVAHFPELSSGCPAPYVKNILVDLANDMIKAVSLLSIPSSLPRSHLPASLDAMMRPTRDMPDKKAFPTHILAVTATGAPSSPSTPTAATFAAQMASGTGAAALYPTNALVLAAYCTKLSILTPARQSSRSSSSLTLPVVPLAVPDPTTFAHLHTYLHTRRTDILLATLLPSLQKSLPRQTVVSADPDSDYTDQFFQENIMQLGQALAQAAYAQGGPQGAVQFLMAHVKGITNLWKNTCALGVSDGELWRVIDLSYETVLIALNCIARA